jgi:hypothetical protein
VIVLDVPEEKGRETISKTTKIRISLRILNGRHTGRGQRPSHGQPLGNSEWQVSDHHEP